MRKLILLAMALAPVAALAQGAPTFSTVTVTTAPSSANQVVRLTDLNSKVNAALPSIPSCSLAMGTGSAGAVQALSLDPNVFTCAGGVLTLNAVTPTAASSVPSLAALQLLGPGGVYYTGAQLQPLFAPIAATAAATLAGVPSTGAVGTAISGVTTTLTPSGATAYASLTVASAEQLPRTAFTGTALPALTPAATGSATIGVYAASTGGSALATSSAITVSAPAATAATIAGAPSSGTVGTAIAGLTDTLTPSGAQAYASLTIAGVEQTPRVAFTGTSVPSLTPASAGTGTVSIYAAATGGTALATSGSITISAPSVTYTASVPSGQGGPGGSGSFGGAGYVSTGGGSISISSGSPATVANQAPSVQMTWTRSSAVTPTVGTGPNQYSTSNPNDITSASLQYINAGYPWFVTTNYVWRKTSGSDNGDGTYYLWALPSNGAWFYTGLSLVMSN